MPADSPRILELRRRVQADPASIAFAQLAEELRRAGANEEAVDVCRTGLARHPGYLSARVTLGRALIELGHLDEAHQALGTVATAAPDNLAAIRGLAEIHQRRGEIAEALTFYRRALELARHDPELEETVERMEKQVAPPTAPEPAVSVEALFDFDRLVQELGVPADQAASSAASTKPATTLPDVPPSGDAFSTLEEALREKEAAPATPASAAAPEPSPAVDELEGWLEALKKDRP